MKLIHGMLVNSMAIFGLLVSHLAFAADTEQLPRVHLVRHFGPVFHEILSLDCTTKEQVVYHKRQVSTNQAKNLSAVALRLAALCLMERKRNGKLVSSADLTLDKARIMTDRFLKSVQSFEGFAIKTDEERRLLFGELVMEWNIQQGAIISQGKLFQLEKAHFSGLMTALSSLEGFFMSEFIRRLSLHY